MFPCLIRHMRTSMVRWRQSIIGAYSYKATQCCMGRPCVYIMSLCLIRHTRNMETKQDRGIFLQGYSMLYVSCLCVYYVPLSHDTCVRWRQSIIGAHSYKPTPCCMGHACVYIMSPCLIRHTRKMETKHDWGILLQGYTMLYVLCLCIYMSLVLSDTHVRWRQSMIGAYILYASRQCVYYVPLSQQTHT
jgi:hypothetical protein